MDVKSLPLFVLRLLGVRLGKGGENVVSTLGLTIYFLHDKSFQGDRYFMLLIDDYSRMMLVAFLKEK